MKLLAMTKKSVKRAKCCVAYKRIKGEVHIYIEDSFKVNSKQHNPTRHSYINFISPRFDRATEGGWTFAVTTNEPTLEQLKSKTQKFSIT